jgi:hypothetical protein
MRVETAYRRTTLYNESEKAIPSIEVICSRCKHIVEVYGTSERSVRRGLAMLRDECPFHESNYYYVEDEDDNWI